jgi:parallel beta-helix repeat protein
MNNPGWSARRRLSVDGHERAPVNLLARCLLLGGILALSSAGCSACPIHFSASRSCAADEECADGSRCQAGLCRLCGADCSRRGSVEPLYPAAGARWNDYIAVTRRGADATAFNQPDAPCPGTGTRPFECLNGGEMRRVALPGAVSCDGLSAADALGAFEWICVGGSEIAFVSVLALGKGLSDLVDEGRFKANWVVVRRGGAVVLKTPPAVWWSNEVFPAPANSGPSDGPLRLQREAAVYTVASPRATSGYNLDADRVSLVTLGSAVLSYSGRPQANCTKSGDVPSGTGSAQGLRAVLCAGSRRHLWIEGRFEGAGTHAVAHFGGASYSRVHRSDFSLAAGDSGAAGLSLAQGSSANLVTSAIAHDNGSGISVGRASGNAFIDCIASHNGGPGVRLSSGASGALLLRVTSADNAGAGFQLGGGEEEEKEEDDDAQPVTNNVLASCAALHNGLSAALLEDATANVLAAFLGADSTVGAAIQLREGANSNYLVNVAAFNAGGPGLSIEGGSDNELRDLVLAHNALGGASVGAISPSSNRNSFLGALAVGDNGPFDCAVGPATRGNLLDGTCRHGVGLSLAAETGLSARGSFKGPAAAGDPRNGTPLQSGIAPAFAVSDWVHFESPLRVWAPAAPLFSMAGRGPCAAGPCQIEDYRLSSSDLLLRGRFGVAVPGAECPAAADPSSLDNLLSDRAPALAHAIELAGDLVRNPLGNHDGLCQSGEACLFTPNLGAYQGEGELSAGCVFSASRGVAGVSLRALSQNGL